MDQKRFSFVPGTEWDTLWDQIDFKSERYLIAIFPGETLVRRCSRHPLGQVEDGDVETWTETRVSSQHL